MQRQSHMRFRDQSGIRHCGTLAAKCQSDASELSIDGVLMVHFLVFLVSGFVTRVDRWCPDMQNATHTVP